MWALEKMMTYTDTPVDSELFGPTSYLRDKPLCPANGTYTINSVSNSPTCSLRSSQGHSI